MAGRETNKPTRFERMYKIWDYLRNHTDRNHPTSIARMRNDKRVRAYIGDKQTVNRLIKDMAHIMNLKEDINQDVNTDDGDDAQGIDQSQNGSCILMISRNSMAMRKDMNGMI